MLLKIIIALAIILMYYDDSKVADAGWLAIFFEPIIPILLTVVAVAHAVANAGKTLLKCNCFISI